MIRMLMLVSICLFMSCFDEPVTGPAKQVYKTSGNFSVTYNGATHTYTVPEGAGSCRILGDSTRYFISVDGSNSKENSVAKISKLIFFGYTIKSNIGTISLSNSDSTFMLGFHDSIGTSYTGINGTITFTTFPHQAGDTLKGVISGNITNIISYDPKSFSALFSLTCESFN